MPESFLMLPDGLMVIREDDGTQPGPEFLKMWTAGAHGAFATASHPADTARQAATEGLNGLSLVILPS